jgi:hypothetical protein
MHGRFVLVITKAAYLRCSALFEAVPYTIGLSDGSYLINLRIIHRLFISPHFSKCRFDPSGL